VVWVLDLFETLEQRERERLAQTRNTGMLSAMPNMQSGG
jgi:hypothetical protein